MSEPIKEEEEIAETENPENPDQEVSASVWLRWQEPIKVYFIISKHFFWNSSMKTAILPIQALDQPHQDANDCSAKNYDVWCTDMVTTKIHIQKVLIYLKI